MTVFKRKDGFDWVLKDGQHLGREREENEAAHLGNCPSKSKNGNESQLCPSDSEQPSPGAPEMERKGKFPSNSVVKNPLADAGDTGLIPDPGN